MQHVVKDYTVGPDDEKFEIFSQLVECATCTPNHSLGSCVQHVVKDYLEGPDNYDSLYSCVQNVSPQTRLGKHSQKSTRYTIPRKK